MPCEHFERFGFPVSEYFVRDPPPLDGVAVTLDLTCLRVLVGPYVDSMPSRALQSRGVVTVRDGHLGLAVRLLSVQLSVIRLALLGKGLRNAAGG